MTCPPLSRRRLYAQSSREKRRDWAAPSLFHGDLRVDHARGINASGAHAGGDIRRVELYHHHPANGDPAGDDHASANPHRDTSIRGDLAGDDHHSNCLCHLL